MHLTFLSFAFKLSPLFKSVLFFFSFSQNLLFPILLKSMDTTQWAQGIGIVKHPMEGSNSKGPPPPPPRARPQKDQALNCPRCNSTNTKFCYYNNYSLSQPRYFCKTCRRYWTEGGSLRNVPVGGGSRKNKRSTPSSSTSSPPSSSTKKLNNNIPDHHLTTHNFPQSASQNPKIHQGQDLNLAYPPPPEDYNSISKFIEVPYSTEDKTHHLFHNPNTTSSSSQSSHHLSAMELLKTGITSTTSGTNNNSSSRGLSSFMPMYNSAGLTFPLQDFKPGLNFSSTLEGFENGYGGIHGIHDQEGGAGARMLFPVEDLKQQQQVPSTNDHQFEQNNNRSQGDHSSGYWSGMLGGGSW